MMASVGSPSMNLVQQGLAVSVENLNDDTLVLIFETGLYNGCPVPCVEWHAQQLVDVYGCANFLLISFPSLNDREFPTKVNNIVGNNCNAKKNTTTSPEHHITRRVKYYRGQENSTTVSIRLYKIMSTILNDIKYVYHYQIKRTQDRYAATVVQQQVMNNVTSNPTQFIAPREPQISSVVPNRLMYQAGKRQTIDVSGQDLYTASGFLYPQNLTNFVESSCIVLSVFTTSGFNEMILRFYHPDILVDRYYYPVLKVGETWRTFPNCLIEFAVQPIMAGEDLTPYGLQFASDLPDEMYPSYDGINAMSLTDTIVYGAPHTLASLTKLYPEGIPFLTTKSSKDESAPDRSLIDLAISDGELTTMLYLVVWEFETKGVFSNAVRSRLDEYLSQSKKVTYEVMLDAIKGEEDDASYEGAETRIRDFVKLLAPAQKNIIPKQPSMLTMNFNPASPTAFVVAHSQMDSVETYFTDTETPVHLIDPITGVIYKCPVVLPSGKTVSIQIAEFKPRFDIFTNKPFEPDQRIVPNRHLQECVDEYIGEKVKVVLKGSITNLEKFKQTLYILLLLIEREDLNSATLAKHFFIKQYWSKFLLSLPFIKSLTNNEKQTLFTILTRGSFPKEKYTAWVLEDKPTEEVSSLFALFPSPNDLYCALELRPALKENDHEKRITAIKLILKYYKVTQVNLLPLFLQQEQDLSSTLSVLHTASERLDRTDFSILVTDLPLDKALLDVLNAPDLTPNQAIKIAEHKFFAAKARQEIDELSSTLTKTLQEKQQIQQEHQQSHQQLMDQIHQLQSENEQLGKKNAFLMKEIEQFDIKQKQVQRQLEQILVCGQRFCVEGSTYMANCDGSCRLGQVWGSNPYTNSSHLCTAAKHAGKIPASGGSFTFKITHGRPSYAASTQNGVTTLTHNMYNTSIKM